jgi:VanZ family protein
MWYITRRYIHLGLISWGPVALALIALFVASGQPAPDFGDNAPLTVYFSGLMPMFPGMWEVVIKKSGHLIAFGVLALLFLRALKLWHIPPRRAMLLAVALTTVYALLDEFHQSFVPGRHPSARDLAIDFGGALLFTILAGRAALLAPQRAAPRRADPS